MGGEIEVLEASFVDRLVMKGQKYDSLSTRIGLAMPNNRDFHIMRLSRSVLHTGKLFFVPANFTVR